MSDKDGKTRGGDRIYYSYIEELTNKTRGYIQEVTYGFEFSLVGFRDNTTKAIILYVLPDSPASKAGLKRGDWILKIDNQDITTDAMANSLLGDVSRTFTIAQYNAERNAFVNIENIKISAAVKMENSPVFYPDVISHGNKKVGYLVYNSFDDGSEEGNKGKPYDDRLRTLSSGLFSGVDEFVLDLRYNNGGLLTCVQLLCGILGPKEYLGEKLGEMIYHTDYRKPYVFTSDNLAAGGKNLNLKRIYILVSSMSASASEAMINLLNPLMDVVVIGRPTEGKNVGSQPFKNADNTWEMHPITCYLANINNTYNYEKGFTPKYEKGDVFDYFVENGKTVVELLENIYELGNPNERMLKVALDLIDGKPVNRSMQSSSSTSSGFEVLGNSLQRKATNSVIIDIE